MYFIKSFTYLSSDTIHMNFMKIGVSFQYIGSLDVPRPSSRVEIVAAMRRIRVTIFSYFTIKFGIELF